MLKRKKESIKKFLGRGRSFLKTPLPYWEVPIVLGILIFLVGYLTFFSIVPGKASRFLLSYYFALFYGPFKITLTWLFSVAAVFLSGRFIILFLWAGVRGVEFAKVFPWRAWRVWLPRFLKESGRLTRYVLPLIFMLFIFSAFYGPINNLNILRLEDETLLRADVALLGRYSFLSLSMLPAPAWFYEAVVFSYDTLPPALFLLALCLIYFRFALFGRLATAFAFGLLLSLPFWAAWPALGPQQRYIDNVYNLPVSTSEEKELSSYLPHPAVQEFLETMSPPEGLTRSALPTTTIPSAHVMWGMFLVVYSYRLDKRLLILTLPLSFLSTFGTVALAQHYFIDIPVGAAMAILVMWLADKVGDYEEARNRPIKLA